MFAFEAYDLHYFKASSVRRVGCTHIQLTNTLFKLQNQTDIFAATTGGAEAMATEMSVPFLGRVPLDPRIGV